MQAKNDVLNAKRFRSDLLVSFSLALIAVFFLASGAISYLNIRTVKRDAELVTHTHEVLLGLTNIMSLMKDAETGERGFLLTGENSYLGPYNAALNQLDEQITRVDQEIADNPQQMQRMVPLKARIQARLNKLASTIEVRRLKGLQAAADVVALNLGKADMDSVRDQIAVMQQTESDLRAARVVEMSNAFATAIASILITAAIGVILSIVLAWVIGRAAATRRREEWLQAGQVGLSSAMMGDQTVTELGEHVLEFLAGYCHVNSGAFFVRDGGGYTRTATYGVPADNDVPQRIGASDGLPGQAVRERRALVLRDVSNTHLSIGAALGSWRPRHVIVFPAIAEDVVEAVIELGFLQPVADTVTDLMTRVAEGVSIAVRSASYRSQLQTFLEETQRQSEELQSQGEELRVNNEELEEQSRALKESHARLEQQQAELEQTNAQLEEQASILEQQRDDIVRSQQELERKAQDLEQASRYKSDFLANMSHELRTPLNSSLILAKLLADNAEGNLTEEQVTFARTIQSSGNDLLTLINDILDLSKIEAGQMEIRPEPVSLERLTRDLSRTFDPIAGQKGLTFGIEIAGDLPQVIDTDRLRLEQVLKNLLSNAFKFTETGKVALKLASSGDGAIAFSVIDTGIGISEEHQQAIFDAFRQADGTISRRYGGTGLGLSISRELVRLLGGTISLASRPGHGSTFTVVIPRSYEPSQAGAPLMPAPISAAPASQSASTAPLSPAMPARPAKPKTVRPHDDRDTLSPAQRSILVVEDDPVFARILYDLAHEQEFKVVIAATAEEALAAVSEFMPSAVVLDIGLPDHSGLSVLDRLKRDVRTRHIPVHVVSGSDYTHTALSLGAAGYMLKPVKREELTDAFRQLEERLNQRVRRVLIVEDDKVQRDSVARLLKTADTEPVAVGSAAECLEALKTQTFDCMVLDLSLPDATGYQLLETLSHEDAYSFPPVIVYTGHDLSTEEETRLRRYSKSIIIKGAKSPERLLDEVSLFLHQVVSDMTAEQQSLLKKARSRDAMLEGRRILIVEDDVRNVYAVTNIFEPLGAQVVIARNGREALETLEKAQGHAETAVDLVLMDVMMPEMDGLTATREIRKRAEWKKLPVIMLTAKAMKDDQERCIDAGANDYMAKPLDVEKLISLVRVWMPR